MQKAYKFYTKGDIFVFIFCLFIGIMAGVLLIITKRNGDFLTIRYDGDVIKTIPVAANTRQILLFEKDHCITFNEEITASIYTSYENYNVITVDNGKVSVTATDCPDKICKNHKEISKEGESIICLPHKLIIELGSYDEDDKKETDSLDGMVH